MAKFDRIRRDISDLVFEGLGSLGKPRQRHDNSVQQSPIYTGGISNQSQSSPSISRRMALVATVGLGSAVGTLPFLSSARFGQAETLVAGDENNDLERQRFIDVFLEVVEYQDIETEPTEDHTREQLRHEFSLFDDSINLTSSDTHGITQAPQLPTHQAVRFSRQPGGISSAENVVANEFGGSVDRAEQSTALTQRFDLFNDADNDQDNLAALIRQIAARTETAMAATRSAPVPTLDTATDLRSNITIASADLNADAISITAPQQRMGNAIPENSIFLNTPLPSKRDASPGGRNFHLAQASRPTPLSRSAVTAYRQPVTLAQPTIIANTSGDSLFLRNIHTGDRLRARFRKDGRMDTGALSELSQLMRDRRNGQSHDIDPLLFGQMHTLVTRSGLDPAATRIDVISGYRSPETNSFLRSRSSGVAKKSYHMQGRAADIRVTGLELSSAHRTALLMAQGGVGYYPSSDFMHLDTGPVRNWPAAYHSLGASLRART